MAPSLIADTVLADGRNTDIVILVMGPPKSGKSSFLNQVIGREAFKVGCKLASCTDTMSSQVLATAPRARAALNKALDGRRIVLVDTPGFDVPKFEHTIMGDEEVLGRVSEWLAASYKRGMKIGAVLYIHDISTECTADSSFRINLSLFSKICGESAMERVLFVTTKWDRLGSIEEGMSRAKELEESHWKEMLIRGASTLHVKSSSQNEWPSRFRDPWDIIHEIVVSTNTRALHDYVLRLQFELVQGRRYLPQTDVGRALNMSLERLLQTAQELKRLAKADAKAGRGTSSLEMRQKEIDKLMGQLRAMNLPKFAVRALQLFRMIPRPLDYT